MDEIVFKKRIGGIECRYSLIKLGIGYQIWSNNVIIGSIAKVKGKWEQTGGRDIGEIILMDIGEFLDAF